MCLLQYVLICEQNFSFFLFKSGLSFIRINCNRISEGLLYVWFKFDMRNHHCDNLKSNIPIVKSSSYSGQTTILIDTP
jgi:hypothetical protein